ncbi:MAG: phenylalanine--tRNA ligase subunit beta [Bifidobacteriaceae bacterium]|jgi:phenylalanyl-tRNA synthetase beta chain|nr:phenylalanine--tRNA ligase subunit beta [Bifidobacteriaceae bacterium]
MLIPLPWLAEYVDLDGRDGAAVAAALVSVGLEEEAIHGSGVTGPLVCGLVVSQEPEPQKNGKTIEWCQVDVGPEHGGVRGIVCGAHNFGVGDKVVVALPGAVLPGPFPITARKTYGHVSDGMIASELELGIGEDHSGILVLSRIGLDPAPGTDMLPLLHLDEQTVEINVTPDRGYCFSVRGVAREFGHATGSAFRDPALLDTPPATPDGFGVEVDDAAPIHGRVGCDRFVARIVRGCRAAGPSPAWMQRRLRQAGMRPISLGVDVTNYVMLEVGQPLHAYDLHGVAEPIVVRRARPGEHLVTLDDVDRTLDPEDLLITDSPDGERGARVLGLAGVMGGASSEVTEATTDLLIEGAHFDPITVARTSRRHKLSSEAAKRFERGADPALPPKAVQRVVDLLLEYGGGEADTAVTDVDHRVAPGPISFDPSYAEALVGVAYPAATVRRVLEAIGCVVNETGGHGIVHGEPGGIAGAGPWQVVPPSWRPDLTRAVDLVEEVARIEGYSAIGSVVPAAPRGGGLTGSQRLRRSVARSLADFGLVEVLSYPFVGSGVFDQLGYAPDDARRAAVTLANPLDVAAPLMRTALLQTLLPTAKRNLSRGFGDIGLFELGLVTLPDGPLGRAPILAVDRRPTPSELAEVTGAVPPQPRHVAGVLMGARVPAGVWGPGRPADWADAVQAARLVCGVAHVDVSVRAVEQAPFHPGRCAAVLALDGTVIGYAGELAPQVLDSFGLPARSVGFELDVDALVALSPEIVPARPVWTHPVAKEDLAFVVDAGVAAAALVDAVVAGAGDLVEDATVFDVYTGDQVPSGKKSVAVALRLRAPDRTLTPEDIAQARNAAVRAAAKAVGAELRG